MKKRAYFIGIGGIGMSAIARFYKHEGYEVAGYDKTPSDLTDELQNEGINIHFDDCVAAIPEQFRNNETLVIYTPAIPDNSLELNYFRDTGNTPVKRSAVLGMIAKDKKVLAVAGTHGKTTTSTLLAHLMTVASNGCTAFLGGVSKNYNSNLLLSKSEWLVAEADEYDRSFLRLYPHIAIVTAADADHLDIYGTEKEMKNAFGDFVSQIDSDGVLILKKGTKIPLDKIRCKTYSYSYDNKEADFYAFNIFPYKDATTTKFLKFDVHTPAGTIDNCTLQLPGWVNIENAVAAVAAAILAGADKNRIKNALETFSGVKRRFDIQINTPELTYIDDYAHHPEELRAAITSVRQMFPGRKILGVFQPHLYTRTRDFADGFADSLSLLDELILLDIYPARELPIEGVTSGIIFDKVRIENKLMRTRDELMNLLKNRDIDVLITLGAGDIDRFVEPITKLLTSQ
ncbi:MAG: UDP-N-acetylmuramate--L-alanine ligase [Dysgonamonadaceae bacterium]|jgi:UDP-N-acetylmuramate--alanine ligase|nr:UDP-N-acetylmuramate--L-alanine ligase [Dysgonamonadaceae bacterium]